MHAGEPGSRSMPTAETAVTGGNTTGARVALAAGVGNFLEWFDFAVYGFLAVTIGTLFFPAASDTGSLLAALAVFGVAFLVRPLGGIVIGAFGDRAGRRAALSLSILLMGACTTLIGVLPSYEQVGLWAPILLVLLRCGQGFSAGGEYAGAAAFLIEYAPRHRRGLYSSVVSATAALGVVGGGMVTLLLTAALDADSLSSWGWRLPFLLAGPLAAVGLYVRLKMEDTPVFRTLESTHRVTKSPLKGAGKYSKSGMGLVFACTAVAGLGFYYLATYLVTHLTVTLGMDKTSALQVAIAGLVLYAAMCPVAGRVGDRIGRRRTMLIGTLGLAATAIPCFILIASGPLPVTLLGIAIFAAFEALANVMLGVLLVELFPAHLRVSGSSIGFNLAQALVGGQGPLVAAALASALAWSFAPALYIVAVSSVAAVVLAMFLPETRDIDLVTAHPRSEPVGAQPLVGERTPIGW
jgi:MFS transporter, MHS family, proline/betaine transporter